MKIHRIERILVSESQERLTSEYQNAGLVFRQGTLSCSGKKFIWYSVDQGSGGYLIHAFLYQLKDRKPHLVLHLIPDPDRISIEARVDNGRIDFVARTRQAPKKELTVAKFLVLR